MRMFLIAAAGLLACSPAFAQTTASTPSQPNSKMTTPQVQGNSQGQQGSQSNSQAQAQQPTVKIAEQIKSNLEQAGFKNIKLMPSAFIVRAEDQNNNPVVMVVNPGSITTVSGTKSQTTIGQDSAISGQDSGMSPGNDNAKGTAPSTH